MVGIVRCHDESSSPMIEVEFHNMLTHHSFSIPNYAGYNMAALSDTALVLGAEKNDGDLR